MSVATSAPPTLVGSRRAPAAVVALVVLAVATYLTGIALGYGRPFDEGFRRYQALRLGTCLVGVVVLAVGVARNRPRSVAPWALLGVLVLSWTLRPIKDLWLAGPGEPPPLDGWYFLAQVTLSGVALVGALGLFVARRRAARSGDAHLDVAVMLCGYLAFEVHVGIAAGWSLSTLLPIRLGAALVFPVSQAACLVLLCALVFIDDVPGRAYPLFWVAVASSVIPNVVTLWLSTGDSAALAILADATPLTVLLLAAAAHDPSMRELTEPSAGIRPPWSPARCVLLGLALAAPMLGFTVGDRPDGLDLVAVVGLFLVAVVALTLRTRRAVRDLTRAEHRSRKAAVTDQLTSLLNRRGFLEHLAAADEGKPLGVAFIDLDHFKQFNDAHGHTAGDDLLAAAGRRIGEAVPGLAVARLGGDEFAVAYRPVPGDEGRGGDELAHAVTAALARPLAAGPLRADITASVGLAEARDEDLRGTPLVLDLLRRADLAQYQAKGAGGDRVVRFTDDLDEAAQRTMHVLDTLRSHTGPDQLQLVYQAIVRTDDQVVVGAESLARLRSPVLGPIPAIEFVTVAERHALIVPLGAQLLDLLVADVQPLLARLDPGFRLSVNLSPLQLARPGIADHLQELAVDDPDLVDHLRLEVTESTLATDDARKVLSQLSGVGYQIAIDDFGTDYASLQYLAAMPVDVLKLDRTFVSGLFENRTDEAIVRHVLALARDLDIDVVAEGVETADQAERLAELGCPFGQGYLWDRPAPGLSRLLHPAS